MVDLKLIYKEDKELERQEKLDIWANTILIYIFVILIALLGLLVFVWLR